MITLEELATNSDDKLVQGFINEVVTESYLLSRMTFDDCLASTATSALIYAYKRLKTPKTAAFRALNTEPAKSKVEIERVKTQVAILSDAWDMDRVAKDAAPDLYALNLEESKNAIVRKFTATVINGDTNVDENGFDGLDKALKGSATEFSSETSLDAIDQATALAWCEEMDTVISALLRDPDALMVSPRMKVKINAICRVLGLATTTPDTAGRQVSSYNGIPIQTMKDGSLATDDVYAVCFGINEFHGITLSGGNAIAVHLPDWEKPGAVKTGDAEFVCGCALKQTKAAGVLRAKAVAAKASSK